MLLAEPVSHTSIQHMDQLSKFPMFHWICFLFILLILVGIELLSVKLLH